jgi:hypothetical protein
MTPTETAGLAQKIASDAAHRIARIAASDYRGKAVFRKDADFEEITITITPAAGNVSWEVAGVSIYLTAQGGRVGRTDRKYIGDLGDAKAYANKTAAKLIADGYRRIS